MEKAATGVENSEGRDCDEDVGEIIALEVVRSRILKYGKGISRSTREHAEYNRKRSRWVRLRDLNVRIKRVGLQ